MNNAVVLCLACSLSIQACKAVIPEPTATPTAVPTPTPDPCAGFREYADGMVAPLRSFQQHVELAKDTMKMDLFMRALLTGDVNAFVSSMDTLIDLLEGDRQEFSAMEVPPVFREFHAAIVATIDQFVEGLQTAKLATLTADSAQFQQAANIIGRFNGNMDDALLLAQEAIDSCSPSGQ
jgi:hypothetical protein